MRRRTIALVIATVLAASTPGASAETTIASDSFTRADSTTLGTSSTGHRWLRDGRSGWGVRSGMARVTWGPSNGVATTWLRVGVTDDVTVAANVTLSPTYRRANAGLVFRYADRANNLWSKIEVTRGNPNGLISIGKTQAGRVTSLLASRSGIGLRNGSTYHLAVSVDGRAITSAVSGGELVEPVTISYTLSDVEASVFAGNDGFGLRAKLAWDEDDRGSRWDDFSVTTLAAE